MAKEGLGNFEKFCVFLFFHLHHFLEGVVSCFELSCF